MNTIDPNKIIRPKEPEKGTKEHTQWLKKVYPTRLLEWRKFEDEEPEHGYVAWYHKDYPENKWIMHYPDEVKLDECLWCYASECKAAKEIEDSWCPLGEDVIEDEEIEGHFYVGDLCVTQLDNGNWRIWSGITLEIYAEIHKEIATPELINLVIENIKKI